MHFNTCFLCHGLSNYFSNKDYLSEVVSLLLFLFDEIIEQSRYGLFLVLDTGTVLKLTFLFFLFLEMKRSSKFIYADVNVSFACKADIFIALRNWSLLVVVMVDVLVVVMMMSALIHLMIEWVMMTVVMLVIIIVLIINFVLFVLHRACSHLIILPSSRCVPGYF